MDPYCSEPHLSYIMDTMEDKSVNIQKLNR